MGAFCFLFTGPRLLYSNRRDIRVIETNYRNETIVADGISDAAALDFHYAEGFLFWTDVSELKIKRAHLTEVEDVISVGLEKPEGLAVDWVTKSLYWTDHRDSSGKSSEIEIAKFDGSNRKVLFSNNLENPRAIAVDPYLG